MAKAKGLSTSKTHTSVAKRTKIGTGKVKTSSMNKHERKTYKKYRGQGR